MNHQTTALYTHTSIEELCEVLRKAHSLEKNALFTAEFLIPESQNYTISKSWEIKFPSSLLSGQTGEFVSYSGRVQGEFEFL